MADVDTSELEVIEESGRKRGGIAYMLMWLIGLFLVVLGLFILFKPTYVLNAQGQIDYGKASLAALIIALIIVIIIALVRNCRS